ncbi:adhesion G-protein coupled receptor F1-like [Pimephales promelas]|nr:adhesion G-protein coupled receptor F1-like [Pimephales promelas]
MAGQDTGQILKYFAVIMAFLLTHECVGQTTVFPKTSMDFQFYSSGIEGQLHNISAETLEYIVVVELNASQTIFIEQIKAAFAFNLFPLRLDNSTEITAGDITTVCQQNVTEYQCVCEDGYAWTYNNCKIYEACDDISLGSCGCINGIPSDGEMCVLESELTFTEFLSEIEIESSSISVIDEMRRYFQNMTFPLKLDELVEVLNVDITTVCNFNDSGYKCVCEDQYFWPCEKCTEYGSCDDITNNTCSCINDIPTDRQFCQPVNEITNNTACAQPTVTPVLITYYTEIQINAENTSIIDQLMNYWMFFDFPYTIIDSINITEINITTVCSLNETQYRCKCEGLFVWPNDTCHSYKACDDIIDGSCTCINALPIDGQFCQLKEVPTVTPTPSTPPVLSPSTPQLSTTLSSTLASMPSTSPTPLSTSPTSTPLSTSPTSTPSSTSPTSTPSSTSPTSTPSSTSPTSTTPSSTLKSMPASTTQLPPPPITTKATVVGISMTLNKIFDSSLTNLSSEDFKDLSGKIKATIEKSYSNNLPGINYISGSTKVHRFRPGSVIADYTIRATSDKLDFFSAANTNVSDSLQAQKIISTKADFARSDDACINEEIGFGKENDVREGICRNGMKGTINYTCKRPDWTPPVVDNCVLDAIYDIKSNIMSLLPAEIPGFLANFSSVIAGNETVITQSPATIKDIVFILNIVANLSQKISEPVMKNFIEAVDIIVSGNVSGTWKELNRGNTSTILLSAIEKISERLIDDFAFTGTSIQLNRTTFKNSFNITSTLPNSTTVIIIPQVPKVTTITIIIFTTLDNVLPTNNHETNNSVVRINGDVVVVKVNETLPKIQFVFDTTDVSLGNAQCVFWNFSLEAWDSSGCKRTGKKEGEITCECNHTTTFSILMSPFSPDSLDEKAYIVLAYITYIGVAISMASLILCLIIEIIVWKSMTRNDTSYMRHVSIVNIAVSLLIADICFIIGAAVAEQEQPTSVGRCSPAVFFMHFFYLALFFWMLISALLLFYRTVMVLSQMSRARMMAIAFIVGYGAPLLIAVITVASTAGPEEYITKELACWLNFNESKALLAFVIPALTIVAINLVVLIVVLYKMLRRGVGATTQPGEKHTLVVIARCVAILTPIFGLTWGFGIGTMLSPNFGIHVVFVLLNSLQGFFILVFGTLLDKKVRELLQRKLSLQKLSSSHTNSTSAGSSSTPRFNFLPWIRRRKVYNVSEANTSSATDRSNSSYAILNT